MPLYNCEKYLEDALKSLTNQTYKNIEIIVIDDRSTDKSWELLQKIAKTDSRIKPFRNKENMRQTRTRNFGVNHATGEYIGFLDSDDIRDVTSIEKQVKYLQAHKDVVAVGVGAEFCDDKMNHLNNRIYPTTDKEIRQKFFRYSPFCLASLIIRAKLLDHDPFRLEMEPSEDVDLSLRLGRFGKFANLPEPLYKVRTHSLSQTQTRARTMEKNTLYLRIKAVFEYDYKMTSSDKIYFFAQMTTMYLMPPRFRFWLFNKLRSS
jgi:glycosyltransferase involved in cell wall biosynthesis